MAEILEGPKEWSKKLTCKHPDCAAVYCVKAEDVKEVGGLEGFLEYHVACPSCETDVRLENTPPVAIEAARNRKKLG
ncbi:MAG: hypothetical protein Q7R85_00405 [bacterium]|nr:hypothetical protein [bacterium]